MASLRAVVEHAPAIARMRRSGSTNREIAQELGISEGAVSQIANDARYEEYTFPAAANDRYMEALFDTKAEKAINVLDSELEDIEHPWIRHNAAVAILNIRQANQRAREKMQQQETGGITISFSSLLENAGQPTADVESAFVENEDSECSDDAEQTV